MRGTVLQHEGATIRIAEELLTQLRGEAEAGYGRLVWGGVEFGGLLLGDSGEAGIDVLEWVGVECEHAYGPAFELSQKDEERLVAQMEQYGSRAIGWFRTTSKELGLTANDQELYERYFPGPHQLALVIRRARGEAPRFALIRRDGAGVPRVVAELGDSSAISAPQKVEREPVPEAEVPREAKPLEEPVPEPKPASTVLEFFGLRTPPFAQAADPDVFHPAASHGNALARLRYGIESRKGFLLLSGEAGTGKTLLMRCLMRQLEIAGIPFSSLLNSRVTVEEFFEWIALDMNLQCAARRKSEVWIALVERLSGRQAAILVDDAHKLSPEVLEELELLGNLENRQGSLLQIVLAGNAMLDDTLDQYRHHSLKQRIVVRTRLAALAMEDTGHYINARLRAAGWDRGPLFDESAVERIWQRTGGVPRLVNLLCEAVLESAFNERLLTVTPDLVDRTD